ncbi:hypothetical protein CHUAL_007309 [Chamberlinius hualienensis]
MKDKSETWQVCLPKSMTMLISSETYENVCSSMNQPFIQVSKAAERYVKHKKSKKAEKLRNQIRKFLFLCDSHKQMMSNSDKTEYEDIMSRYISVFIKLTFQLRIAEEGRCCEEILTMLVLYFKHSPEHALDAILRVVGYFQANSLIYSQIFWKIWDLLKNVVSSKTHMYLKWILLTKCWTKHLTPTDRRQFKTCVKNISTETVSKKLINRFLRKCNMPKIRNRSIMTKTLLKAFNTECRLTMLQELYGSEANEYEDQEMESNEAVTVLESQPDVCYFEDKSADRQYEYFDKGSFSRDKEAIDKHSDGDDMEKHSVEDRSPTKSFKSKADRKDLGKKDSHSVLPIEEKMSDDANTLDGDDNGQDTSNFATKDRRSKKRFKSKINREVRDKKDKNDERKRLKEKSGRLNDESDMNVASDESEVKLDDQRHSDQVMKDAVDFERSSFEKVANNIDDINVAVSENGDWNDRQKGEMVDPANIPVIPSMAPFKDIEISSTSLKSFSPVISETSLSGEHLVAYPLSDNQPSPAIKSKIRRSAMKTSAKSSSKKSMKTNPNINKACPENVDENELELMDETENEKASENSNARSTPKSKYDSPDSSRSIMKMSDNSDGDDKVQDIDNVTVEVATPTSHFNMKTNLEKQGEGDNSDEYKTLRKKPARIDNESETDVTSIESEINSDLEMKVDVQFENVADNTNNSSESDDSNDRQKKEISPANVPVIPLKSPLMDVKISLTPISSNKQSPTIKSKVSTSSMKKSIKSSSQKLTKTNPDRSRTCPDDIDGQLASNKKDENPLKHIDETADSEVSENSLTRPTLKYDSPEKSRPMTRKRLKLLKESKTNENVRKARSPVANLDIAEKSPSIVLRKLSLSDNDDSNDHDMKDLLPERSPVTNEEVTTDADDKQSLENAILSTETPKCQLNVSEMAADSSYTPNTMCLRRRSLRPNRLLYLEEESREGFKPSALETLPETNEQTTFEPTIQKPQEEPTTGRRTSARLQIKRARSVSPSNTPATKSLRTRVVNTVNVTRIASTDKRKESNNKATDTPLGKKSSKY